MQIVNGSGLVGKTISTLFSAENGELIIRLDGGDWCSFLPIPQNDDDDGQSAEWFEELDVRVRLSEDFDPAVVRLYNLASEEEELDIARLIKLQKKYPHVRQS